MTEEDVKHHFVIPFLELLGWDVDCRRFEQNDSVHGRADILLYDGRQSTEPVMVIETKRPRKSGFSARDADAGQAKNYALGFGLKIAVLTDYASTQVYLLPASNIQIVDDVDKHLLFRVSYRRYQDSWNVFYALLSRESVQNGMQAKLIDYVQTVQKNIGKRYYYIRNRTPLISALLQLFYSRDYDLGKPQQLQAQLPIAAELVQSVNEIIESLARQTTLSQMRFDELLTAITGIRKEFDLSAKSTHDANEIQAIKNTIESIRETLLHASTLGSKSYEEAKQVGTANLKACSDEILHLLSEAVQKSVLPLQDTVRIIETSVVRLNTKINDFVQIKSTLQEMEPDSGNRLAHTQHREVKPSKAVTKLNPMLPEDMQGNNPQQGEPEAIGVPDINAQDRQRIAALRAQWPLSTDLKSQKQDFHLVPLWAG